MTENFFDKNGNYVNPEVGSLLEKELELALEPFIQKLIDNGFTNFESRVFILNNIERIVFYKYLDSKSWFDLND